MGKKASFIQDRYQRARNILVDLVRTLNLQDRIENAIVQADIVDQRTGPRRRSDSINSPALLLDARQDFVQSDLAQSHFAAKLFERLFSKFLFLTLQNLGDAGSNG